MITGASSGLGKEFVYICARMGHNLILVARSASVLREMQQHINNDFGVEVIPLSSDLSDLNSVSRIEKSISEQPIFVNMLIHAAGFGSIGSFSDNDNRKNLAIIEVNVSSVVHLTHYMLQNMIKYDEGRILFVSSTAAFTPGPWFSIYHASKAFISSFSLALSRELRESKVKVTLLCPGQMKTNFQSAAGIEEIITAGNSTSPTKVAEYGFSALINGKPMCICGIMNRLKTIVLKYLPQKISLKLVAWNNIRKIPKKNRNSTT